MEGFWVDEGEATEFEFFFGTGVGVGVHAGGLIHGGCVPFLVWVTGCCRGLVRRPK
ncbi:hypothetical protein [Propionibacterium phage TCUCAP1]|nr:hypothetical protein [Propionibacterium phage TCUCAP1]